MSSSLEFFATIADVEMFARQLDAAAPGLKFLPMASATPSVEHEVSLLGALSTLPGGRYLATFLDLPVVARRVESDVTGGVWYAVDQLANPNSVLIFLGTQRPGILTPGRISSLSTTPQATTLFKLISKPVRGPFRKVKSYWVGPGALEMLRAGARLTASETASRVYDLQE